MCRWVTVPWPAWLGVAIALAVVGPASKAAIRTELADALERLAREGAFSGAVVILGSDGVRFAQGFGFADPFTGRRFTPDTPVDSASLAKPVTAAAVLMLARDGRIDLDAPVGRYLADYPHPQATVRHLLAHSAGLPVEESLEPLGGKTNERLLAEMSLRGLPPLFAPGTALVYCNFCYTTLAMLVERVSGKPYLPFVRERLAVPAGVTIRPARLAEWRGRAIGHRHGTDGKIERADSYENELFYGSANLSISAHQLARWGAEWWKPTLKPLTVMATTPASIAGNASGLSWGNWYCAPGGGRCHYVGHHEGFHHLLYWDGDRRISVAMVTNNTLAPALQQRLQRALVAFAQGSDAAAKRELSMLLLDNAVRPAAYRFPTGETVTVVARENRMTVTRGGIDYLAYRIGSGIRYMPGLDVYVAGAQDGGLYWLSLYEDVNGVPVPPAAGSPTH